MSNYLKPGDEGCFQDMEIKPLPKLRWEDMIDYTTPCPVCKGYGGWNLKLNAYPNNPTNPHFRQHCPQCNGWGYVKKGSTDETCVPHEMKEVAGSSLNPPRPQWNCYHYYVCQKCGKIEEVDSSG
jgi:hypothetical protein